jgi:DNA-binding Xre family transcriptional regulator
LIARKMSIKDIASIVGISEKKVNEIKEQMG